MVDETVVQSSEYILPQNGEVHESVTMVLRQLSRLRECSSDLERITFYFTPRVELQRS